MEHSNHSLQSIQGIDLKKIPLKFYNTATRQKEELKPLRDDHFRMYTCGPTVYHFAHIGNFRTFIFEDLFRRTLKFFGYGITQVMNLTDVDDKTIKGAIAGNLSLDDFTKPYKEAFFEDLKSLNIEKVEYYPCATDYIPEMIQMIECLMEKGIAYRGDDGSVYFSISKFPRYGCLSHLNLDELETGASERVAHDEYVKDHVADFVLWKSYEPDRDGQIFWESPFGAGRPGWHLECSAMAMKLLGDTFDLHLGGVDNMFPHHENEIAQSESCSGEPFAKFWMHAEHLLVDNKKMSKSLGNFYTLRDLLSKGYTGVQIRYLLMQGHYKTPINFTFQGLEAAKNSLQRLNDFIQRLYGVTGSQSEGKVTEVLKNTYREFSEALADDLNISAALATVFDFVRVVNGLCDEDQVGQNEAHEIIQFLLKLNTVLDILSFEKEEPIIPIELQHAFEKRQQARRDKDWKLSDELRDYIQQQGYVIEDTPKGARLKKH